jgi:hypothetical protein
MHAPGPLTRGRDLIGSEWVKLRSVRSTYYSLLVAVVLSIGISAIASGSVAGSWVHASAAERAQFDPFRGTLTGLLFAQLAFGVLGVLAISSEYGTGQIRTTFAAAPHRHSVLTAKAAVLAAVTVPLSLVVSFASFLIGQALLSSTGASVTLATPGALTAVLGAAGYLVAITLLGFGLGAVIRHSAGAITALTALVLVLPMITGVLPSPWDIRTGRLFPDLMSITARHVAAPGQLSPWAALLVCVAWAAAAIAVSLFMVNRRDA